MSECEVNGVVVIRTEQERLESISRLVSENKTNSERISVDEDGDDYLIYIESDDKRWDELLETNDVPFKHVLPALNIGDATGLPESIGHYFLNVLGVQAMAFTPILASVTAQDCTKTKLITSGESSGEETEFTFNSPPSPETIRKARNSAFVNASKAALAELNKLSPGKCTPPCAFRYFVTYSTPTNAGTTTVASGSLEKEYKGFKGTINLGARTKVTFHVKWSIWKTCAKKGESGFDNSKPPAGDGKTITVGGTTKKVKCEKFFKTGKVLAAKEYTDDISWSSEESEETLWKEANKLIPAALEDCLNKAAEAAGDALNSFAPCSTVCPTATISMYISPPKLVKNLVLKRAYAVGYENAAQVGYKCNWWVYKDCK